MNQTSSSERRRARRPGAWGSVCASSLLALACGSGGADDSAPAPDVAGNPSLPAEPQPDDSAPVEPVVPSDPVTPDTPSSPPPVAEAPDDTPEPPARCLDELSFDDLYAAIALDLVRSDDAQFLRYVSLSNRINQGTCAADLDAERLALVNAVNSLSTETRVAIPEPIDDARVIYRIDLRDLGWDEPTEVGAEAFSDKWEAIIASSPYAVELEGDDADTAKLASLTTVPVLFLDALIDATVVGDLYYSLVGIGPSAIDLFGALGIDFADTPVRAGTSESVMSAQDAIIQRFDLGTAQGFYWSRFDVADATVGQSIFSDPFGFGADVVASLFTLPNGFMAFALFDATFARVADTNVLVDETQRDGRMHNSVSCRSCHAIGVNPVRDEVRSYVESNPLDFDAQTIDDVREQFVAQTELDEVVGQDNATYAAALARAGIVSTSTDGVSAIYQRFDRTVTLDVAAGELGITPEALSRDLVTLIDEADPILAALPTQGLQRVQFDETYLDALCVLLVSRGNRPLDAECAATE